MSAERFTAQIREAPHDNSSWHLSLIPQIRVLWTFFRLMAPICLRIFPHKYTQGYRCIVCYLLPWPTEKSNLRKSLSWLLQGEDVTAAGKWCGWSHWVHSQAAEGNQYWLSVFHSHTGSFWGSPSHFSLSGSIFIDTPPKACFHGDPKSNNVTVNTGRHKRYI